MSAKRTKIILALVLALIGSTYISTQIFIGQSPKFNFPFISSIPVVIKQVALQIIKSEITKAPLQTIHQNTSPVLFVSVIPSPTLPPQMLATQVPPHLSTPTRVPTLTIRPTAAPTRMQPRTPSVKPTTPPPTSPPKQNVSCPTSSSEEYGTLSIISEPTTNAATHADINLQLRGYSGTNTALGLIDVGGDNDGGKAPQLSTVFNPKRKGTIASTYKVNHWDWNSKTRGGPIEDPAATLVGLGSTPGEAVYVPNSAYSIGDGKQVLVLFATNTSLTLKYTREDNVVSGYTLHFDDICVDPNLLSLYNAQNSKGRSNLPALAGGKKVGTARTSEVRVAIRDTGSFMDPRVRKDWWLGY